MIYRILIVDDEEGMCLSLSEILQDAGYETVFTTNSLDVKEILNRKTINLIIMDVRMPQMGGIDLLSSLQSGHGNIPVIMITGYPSVDNAVKAMRYGAVNFFTKPLKIPDLLTEIKKIFESPRQISKKDITGKTAIQTMNPTMLNLIENIKKVAVTDAPVLILGESGTGKEHVANMISMYSNRKSDAFIKVNCAAIPDNLLESELFGYEKGAFTGAVSTREGKFELADNGTLFLDEIGDMSFNTQSKMLRVLEENTFERLGGNKIFTTNVRVISATNKNLDECIKKGIFREDLYYRLSVVTIELTPLRQRPEDIPLLTDIFISHFNSLYSKTIRGISPEVKSIFLNHQWPGNIRELKNCLQRAVIFCEEDTIQCSDLSSQYSQITPTGSAAGFKLRQDNLNREIIRDALEKSGGNKQQAAEILNIDRKTLYNRMKRLGMQL